jgi:hypothetical protein
LNAADGIESGVAMKVLANSGELSSDPEKVAEI